MRGLELWAHRGAHGGGGPLENTLPAFARALEEGCHGVELDVHASADGVAMVFHDETLGRLRPGDARALRSLPASALSGLRLVGGSTMPRLTEVLDLLGGRTWINVEFKDARALGPLLRALDGRRAGILLSSFDLGGLRAAAEVAPSLPRAALMGDARPHTLGHLAELAPLPSLVRCGAHAWHVPARLVRPRRVRWLRALGVAVRVWTVNDPAEARRLRALGVDGVFTDRPAHLRGEGP